MRLICIEDHVVGADAHGLYAWDISGPSPIRVATREDASPWTDTWGHEVGGTLSAPAGRSFARLHVWGSECAVTLHDPSLAQPRRVPLTRRVQRWSVALSPDGATVAAHAEGDGVLLFDAHTGEVRRAFDGEASSGVAISPDGRWAAAGDTGQAGGQLYLLDLAEGDDEVARRDLTRPTARPPLYDASFEATFSASGALVAFTTAAWGARGVVVYEVASGAELWSTQYEMPDPNDEIWDALQAHFAHEDAWLVLAPEGGTLRAFGARDGAPLETLELPEATPPYLAVDAHRHCLWCTEGGALRRLDGPARWSQGAPGAGFP